jgi:hypothetical protein
MLLKQNNYDVILSGAILPASPTMLGALRSRRIFCRSAKDPSTPQNSAIAPFCVAQDDKFKILLYLVTLLLMFGCSKHESAASKDSLFAQPLKDSVVPPPSQDPKSGLWVDSSVVRQQPDINALKRLSPIQVVGIYEAYRPLRNSSTTQEQVDSFLAKHKITAKELHSILAEGDRLGWLHANGH